MTDPAAITLCALDELEEGGSRGFHLDRAAQTQSIFLVRKNDKVFGYMNSCPHTGAPLEWMPDQFLSLDGEEIQCALHGARFNISTGLCVHGPCLGGSLTPISIEVSNRKIIWKPGSTS